MREKGKGKRGGKMEGKGRGIGEGVVVMEERRRMEEVKKLGKGFKDGLGMDVLEMGMEKEEG